MRAHGDSATLSPYLRLFFAIVASIVLFGCLLLLAPGFARPHWPWTIAPFNAAFLGGIYLSELFAVAISIAVNRWAPIRVVLPMALVFVAVVSVVSLFYLGMFKPERVATYAWFVAYFGSLIALAIVGWRYRGLPPEDMMPTPGWLRACLLAQSVALALYGIGLLVAPGRSSAFWPWRIDSFHAQVYSAVFLSSAVGSLLIARAAAGIELLAFGLTETSFGVCSITGLVMVDASQHRVAWSALGTFSWLAGCGILVVVGLVLVMRALIGRPLVGWQVRALP